MRSPTSSSSTTKCSTGTSPGSARSASRAWSSTRRTSSRTCTRSARKYVLGLAEAHPGDSACGDPLLLALTGTPLINDIDDFRRHLAVPRLDRRRRSRAPQLMEKLEETELTPADFGFYAAAREAVIDMGIVRRRKIDVAADLPEPPRGRPSRRARRRPRPLDPPGRDANSAARLVARFKRASAAGRPDSFDGDDDAHRTHLIRLVAQSELEESKSAKTGRERLHDGAQDRPGQGATSPRLRRAARALGRQGRVLREAHRRDGCRGGGLRRAAT